MTARGRQQRDPSLRSSRPVPPPPLPAAHAGTHTAHSSCGAGRKRKEKKPLCDFATLGGSPPLTIAACTPPCPPPNPPPLPSSHSPAEVRCKTPPHPKGFSQLCFFPPPPSVYFGSPDCVTCGCSGNKTAMRMGKRKKTQIEEGGSTVRYGDGDRHGAPSATWRSIITSISIPTEGSPQWDITYPGGIWGGFEALCACTTPKVPFNHPFPLPPPTSASPHPSPKQSPHSCGRASHGHCKPIACYGEQNPLLGGWALIPPAPEGSRDVGYQWDAAPSLPGPMLGGTTAVPHL